MNRKALPLLLLALLLTPSFAAADNCRGGRPGHGSYPGYSSGYSGGYNGGYYGGYNGGNSFIPGGYRPNPWAGQHGYHGYQPRYQARPVGFYGNSNALINHWERTGFASDDRIDPWERQMLQESRQDFYHDLKHELRYGERAY